MRLTCRKFILEFHNITVFDGLFWFSTTGNGRIAELSEKKKINIIVRHITYKYLSFLSTRSSCTYANNVKSRFSGLENDHVTNLQTFLDGRYLRNSKYPNAQNIFKIVLCYKMFYR